MTAKAGIADAPVAVIISCEDGSEFDAKELLGIPEEQSAVAVLLIGHPADGTDSVTGATERNPSDDVVTNIK